MRYSLFFTCLFFVGFHLAWGQTVTTDPIFPKANQPLTITVDVAGTSFAAITGDVWIWTWVERGATDVNAPTNVDPATSAQNAAKCTKTGPTTYQITLQPSALDFYKPNFSGTAAELDQIGFLLKGTNGFGTKTPDMFITFAQDFAVTFTQPNKSLLFVDPEEVVPVSVATNETADIELFVDEVSVGSLTDVTALNYDLHVPATGGGIVRAEATSNGVTKEISFTYIIRGTATAEARPAGIRDGINYHENDPTQVTLSLWAPGKNSVYVVGDFTDWEIDVDYQLKRDGEHFWITLSGITPGEEYGFQYLVDESIFLADPYADKILDPDDQYISSAIYPSLKPFPEKALKNEWYFNRVSVFQTAQTPYAWQTNDYVPPAKENLIIYEVLVRDLFNNARYQYLIDTLSYFKTLGINAIELMPIMEFNGNNSWGYNPTFMFAPDKAYGTKNKLKEFVDACHAQGIAVILDIALNHQDTPSPYVLMDFNFETFKPNPTNPWFNVEATHPFSVFFDMNHESAYTKAFVDTVNAYWLGEYRIDGFRFDLSKGFTQNEGNEPGDVAAWSSYDAVRIGLLKRMADKIWSRFPQAYVILEHLAANDEEKELADYGMLLWGKMTDPYNQNTMGFANGSDISGVYHKSRTWTNPHLVGYMESHDEERLMVKNLDFGNVSGSYSVKTLKTALARMQTASTVFYTVPGPKMLWQFGELGYDISINRCENGTVSDACRLSPKPVRWSYKNNDDRYALYLHNADLLRLRKNYDVFREGDVTFMNNNDLAKYLVIKNKPYTATPGDSSEMNVVVVTNFDVVERTISVTFPHIGTWYDYYFSGIAVDVPVTSHSVTLPPGGFKIYTDVSIQNFIVTDVENERESSISVFPNPVQGRLKIASDRPATSMKVFSLDGKVIAVPSVGENELDMQGIRPGLYILEVNWSDSIQRFKIVKQ